MTFKCVIKMQSDMHKYSHINSYGDRFTGETTNDLAKLAFHWRHTRLKHTNTQAMCCFVCCLHTLSTHIFLTNTIDMLFCFAVYKFEAHKYFTAQVKTYVCNWLPLGQTNSGFWDLGGVLWQLFPEMATITDTEKAQRTTPQNINSRKYTG